MSADTSVLYFAYCSMKASFTALDEIGPGAQLRVSTYDVPVREGPSSLASHSDDHSAHSMHSASPHYWQSPQGQKVIKSLPVAAPPLDLRGLEWGAAQEALSARDDGALRDSFAGDSAYFDEQDEEEGKVRGRMVSTAHPAVGSALQAARRSNLNRAVTAPE
jgi:hypothetical protein